MPPPTEATLGDGTVLDLRALAEAITAVHLRRHPEDVERYGELAEAWCIHDAQHFVSWAVSDPALHDQYAWLARLLEARGYPRANLIDCIEISAKVLEADGASPARSGVGVRLREAAGRLVESAA